MAINAYPLAKDGTKKLSTDFKVREFRCKDGSDPIFIDSELVEVLQKIRTHFGKAVNINSAFRTASHNAKQKNASHYSQHLYGRQRTSGSLVYRWIRWPHTSKPCSPTGAESGGITTTTLYTSMCALQRVVGKVKRKETEEI